MSDVSGKTVLLPTANWKLHTGNCILHTGNLPPGIYFLEIYGRDFREVRKVVVE
jgi:hypothetical protein